uniref:restriction endonuclease subunit S n=1 Tax=Sphingomonas populi TaxID=2484750 RepID=UPI0013EE436F|nr:restriction endonuclease subunit S [Sphingomonas populi]
MLSVSIHSGISQHELSAEERDRKTVLIEDRSAYKRVRPGYLAYNMMRAWQGAVGVSTVDGAVSPAYVVAKPTGEIHSAYYQYLLRTPIYIGEMHRGSKGIADFRKRLYWEQFRQIVLPVPPIDEQREIAAFLDRETGKIDLLIEKKEQFLRCSAARIEALVDRAISDSDVPRVRFEHVTRRIHRPATLSEHTNLVRLGLYNRGRGIFKKPATDEEGMGDSDFFFVKEDDLIISGQFAWEGAVALASSDEEGCVVSHRYPIYRGENGVKSAYLTGLLRTNFGDFLLNEASRGSAGRNRPLNTGRLAKEKIPVPGMKLQEAIEQAIKLEKRMKAVTQASIALLQEHRAALVTAAVMGLTDIANTTARKIGE